MQEYTKYNYQIRLDDLAETVREAQAGGCRVMVIINGEYYEVSTNREENKS